MDHEVFLSIKRVCVMGDWAHAWYLRIRMCSNPSNLVAMICTKPWYMSPSGHESLNVCVNCSLIVVVCLRGSVFTFQICL